jgi:hypothetical protein
MLAALGLAAPLAAAPAAPPDRARDALGPAMVAATFAARTAAPPRFAWLHPGMATRRGDATVCGALDLPGHLTERRFLAVVPSAALRYETLAHVVFDTEPGFARGWARHCVVPGS